MPVKKQKIIFIGTSSFAVPSLKNLIENNYQILSIVTAKDKPAGRNNELSESPVKKTALEYNINIIQPDKIIESKDKIQQLNPDLIISSSYGQIIPKDILDIPEKGSLNIHPSLLPKYRGPSPIQNAILNGDSSTGITIIKMDEKMDHGPIVIQKKTEINPNDTYEILEKKLSEKASDLLISTLPKYFNDEIKTISQNEKQASYTKLLKREDGKIDWNKSAQEIERKIRAFYPWPGTWTMINNKRIKIIKAKISDSPDPKNPAIIKAKNSYLYLELVQPEGKKPMSGEDFFRGN